MDHMERGTLKFDALKLVVLDETDRMLDMGFRDDIEKILKTVPEKRQLLFFSATIPRAIQDLIGRYSRDPEWIRIESVAQNAPQVEQVYFEVDRRSKIEALTRLIDVHDFRYGIIFCSTKIMVDELDEHLHARGYATDRLHGDLSQMQRDRVMDKFRRRGFEFLIATDVAARGLDVDDLEVVFNFDLPNDAEDYTHRIGRTGRAGKSGRAFTFVSGREIYKLQSMVQFARIKIRRESIPSLDQVEEARANVFFEKLRATLDAKLFPSHDRMIDRLLDQGYSSTDICSALIHLLQGAAPEKPSAPKKPAPAPLAKSEKPPERKLPAAAPAPKLAAPSAPSDENGEDDDSPPRRSKYERAPRTGREPGMTTLFLNVGRKQVVTPADIVGKIAGVTRLPAEVVGSIDIHQRHTLVDVAEEHVALIVKKLDGHPAQGRSLGPGFGERGNEIAGGRAGLLQAQAPSGPNPPCTQVIGPSRRRPSGVRAKAMPWFSSHSRALAAGRRGKACSDRAAAGKPKGPNLKNALQHGSVQPAAGHDVNPGDRGEFSDFDPFDTHWPKVPAFELIHGF